MHSSERKGAPGTKCSRSSKLMLNEYKKSPGNTLRIEEYSVQSPAGARHRISHKIGYASSSKYELPKSIVRPAVAFNGRGATKRAGPCSCAPT